MNLRAVLLGLILLSWGVAAHAQVGVCPAGTIPNGTQTSAMECAPDPDYQTQQQPAPPPPVWADRWGSTAGALPGTRPAFGAASNMPSEESAKQAAIAECEATPGTHCETDQVYYNACFGEAWGPKSPVGYIAGTLDAARRLSMQACEAKGQKCVAYYSACSLPVRIQ